MTIDRLDHLVLTVASIKATLRFYGDVLDMRVVRFGDGRTALAFGAHKLNLHEVGRELDPKAARPTAGSADFCLVTTRPLAEIEQRCRAHGVPVEAGPVPRTGALGPILSLYLRDPDGNKLCALYRAPRGG